MTFRDFCDQHNATADEAAALFAHLLSLRTLAMLRAFGLLEQSR